MLNFGTVFYDLVVKCADVIQKRIQVSYDPPSDADRSFAKTMMKLSHAARKKAKLLGNDDDDDDDDNDSTLDAETLQKFLNIFNGNWKSSIITHHCSVLCPCNGTKNIGKLAGELFAQVILGARPVVPALSRWLKCAATAKWFMLRVQNVSISYEL